MIRTVILGAISGAFLLLAAGAAQADPIPSGMSPITSFGDTPLSVGTPQATPQASTYQCGGEIGYLRRVSTAEIQGLLDQDRIMVMPVCEGSDRALRNDGNAGALRGEIANNPTLVAALGAVSYGPTDVVGVRMTGEDSAVLYVQTYHY